MSDERTAGGQTAPDEIEVTNETPFERILSVDRTGGRVYFDPTPQNWKDLTSEEFSQLSSFTKTTYSTMKSLSIAQRKRDAWEVEHGKSDVKVVQESKREELSKPFEKRVNPASATGRSTVMGVPEGYSTVWSNPTNVAWREMMGYRKVTKEVADELGIKTHFPGDGSVVKQMSRSQPGEADAVLMIAPEEVKKEQIGEASEKSQIRMRTNKQRALGEIGRHAIPLQEGSDVDRNARWGKSPRRGQ